MPLYKYLFPIFTIFLMLFTVSKTNPHPKLPCEPPIHNRYPFCNTSLSISARAKALISHLTLHEKIQQLSNNASAVERLGIPAYQWWSESLHGIAINGPGVTFNGSITSATSFPQVLLQAATFNRTLWFTIASAISVEAMAMYNFGQAGLTYWAPNINIFRDPRWGRGQETPGEDPMVVGDYAIEYVKGFQGNTEDRVDDDLPSEYHRILEEDGNELMLSACCKHFIAYDLEKWGNFSRYSFDAKVSVQDLEETYLPPFQSCIQDGQASCLMCSYNKINGVPACAHGDLLQKARTTWGFNGYITSDCDAVATILEYQRYVETPEDAVADVLKAGMDINCGTYMLRHTETAVEQGKVQEEDINRALFNLFSVQLRLGLFNGDQLKEKFRKIGPQNVCNQDHLKLALDASKQGIVLLKNEKNFLPLNPKSLRSIAIIGPSANDTTKLGGSYSGVPCNPKTILQGIQSYVEKTTFEVGCRDISCNSSDGFEEAIRVGKEADVILIVAGLDSTQETEDLDRVSLLLPGKQMDLISTLALECKRKLVLILTGGGPLDILFAKTDQRIPSILWIGYPGETGGQALAEIIFGEYNPGGRLPVTWYPESFSIVPMNDMRMRPDSTYDYPGRTYKFYTGEAVYEFGYGLSYSTFSYKFLSVPRKINLSQGLFKSENIPKSLVESRDEDVPVPVDDVTSCEALKFSVPIMVANNGDMDGSHVVLLFSRPKKSYGAPRKQLVGFSRVYTEAYESIEVHILLEPCKHLSLVNEEGIRILTLGHHILSIEDVEHHILLEA